MTDFNIVATQDDDLSELERIRINMAYNFYCELIKRDDLDLEDFADIAVSKADILLKALGYDD